MLIQTHNRFGRRATLLCFSHLRWDFVYQRPQHLLSRAAKTSSVYYFEEPVFGAQEATIVKKEQTSGVVVIVPHLPDLHNSEANANQLRKLLDQFLETERPDHLTLWYYTPLALRFSDHVRPDYCVYDCMDELSAFRFAPPELIHAEKQLLARCDIVFTGGESLFESKRDRHRNVYCFPSSVDKAHFASAREMAADAGGNAPLQVGYFGVIDERMDLELVERLAELRPHMNFVMVGPLAKIAEGELPRASNLHWLGPRNYLDLPKYLAEWDAGFMPFALNESTRFISPTKTPEFLSAGLPVVSTNIADVARPYGHQGLVEIAHTAEEFADSLDRAVARRNDKERLAIVDAFLADKSWDNTFLQMQAAIAEDLHSLAS
jgi:glycosyltransferase involved in cell wall biosynthesis